MQKILVSILGFLRVKGMRAEQGRVRAERGWGHYCTINVLLEKCSAVLFLQHVEHIDLKQKCGYEILIKTSS